MIRGMKRIRTSVMTIFAAMAVVFATGSMAIAQEGEVVGSAPKESGYPAILLGLLFVLLILIASFKPAKRTHLD